MLRCYQEETKSIIVPALIPTGASYSTIGPHDGSTFVDDNTVGTQAWSNPSDAQYGDEVSALCTVQPGTDSNYLKATGFNFSVPAGVLITGVLVEIAEREYWDLSNIKDYSVKLVKGGTISGTNKASATAWPSRRRLCKLW